MSSKLKDIKDTTSDAVEIIRELGTPEVQLSLANIRETAKIAKELVDSLKDPAIVANIDNVRKTAESFEKASSRIEAAIAEVKATGLLEEVKGAVGSARTALDSFKEGKGPGDTIEALKEMLHSVSGLVDELRLTVASAKSNGIVRNVEETAREARQIFSKKSE